MKSYTKKKKIIYIFGNPLLDFDNLPLKLVPELQKKFPVINFVIADPNENINPTEKELVLIDTIEGIENVIVIDDIDKLEIEKAYSVHDFDVAFNLRLLKKIGKLKKIKIIGMPMKGDERNILEELKKIIKSEI